LEYRYLLVVRFTLLNVVAIAALFAGYMEGWLDGMLEGPTFLMTFSIFAVFVYGLIACAAKIWRTSEELNDLKTGMPVPESRAGKYLRELEYHDGESRSIKSQMVRLKLSNRIAIVRHTANSLVFLGLVGTVIGFIVALSGVDPESVSSAEAVGPMVAKLIQGMSIALYTTLVGAVLYLWLIVNHRMLASGTVNLINTIIEMGEARVRT
jgi:hypothetical protein